MMAYRFQVSAKPMASSVATHSLLAQVLGITGFGLCITAFAAYLFQGLDSFPIGLIAMLIGFGVLFGINAARANEALALGLFYLFAFLEGVGIAPTIHNYLQAVGPAPVINAALTTGVGMFALAAIVYTTGLDLRRFAGWLYGALLVAILGGIVLLFVHFIQPATYSWIVLVIFTGLVLVDFARIRAGGDGLNPVQLAVQIYLDALNIFLLLLSIFGGRRRD
jgi:FtsH-binding integral membrane protein